jgi:hypothetical protein
MEIEAGVWVAFGCMIPGVWRHRFVATEMNIESFPVPSGDKYFGSLDSFHLKENSSPRGIAKFLCK